jgi:hypothetical protein
MRKEELLLKKWCHRIWEERRRLESSMVKVVTTVAAGRPGESRPWATCLLGEVKLLALHFLGVHPCHDLMVGGYYTAS